MITKKTIKQRFEEKVFPEPNTGCWIWAGAYSSKGYGYIKSVLLTDMLAHRVSYSIYKGEVPRHSLVCHTCDCTYCVNPDHLYLGTPQSNMNDKVSKGRNRNRFTGKLNQQSK